jgi:hypothetical protein
MTRGEVLQWVDDTQTSVFRVKALLIDARIRIGRWPDDATRADLELAIDMLTDIADRLADYRTQR